MRLSESNRYGEGAGQIRCWRLLIVRRSITLRREQYIATIPEHVREGKRSSIDGDWADDAAGWSQVVLARFSEDQAYTVACGQQCINRLEFHQHCQALAGKHGCWIAAALVVANVHGCVAEAKSRFCILHFCENLPAVH